MPAQSEDAVRIRPTINAAETALSKFSQARQRMTAVWRFKPGVVIRPVFHHGRNRG